MGLWEDIFTTGAPPALPAANYLFPLQGKIPDNLVTVEDSCRKHILRSYGPWVSLRSTHGYTSDHPHTGMHRPAQPIPAQAHSIRLNQSPTHDNRNLTTDIALKGQDAVTRG